MHDTCLSDRLGPYRADGVGEAGEPVPDHDATIADAPVLDLGEHVMPVLGALAAVADPQPENVAFAVHRHRDRDIDRPVRDLALADL